MNPESEKRETPLICGESQPVPDSGPSGNSRRPVLAVIAFVILGLFVISGKAQATWEEIAQFLSLHGTPEPSSANVLSEHEIEGLDQHSPQAQAELLMERSINHYRGANDEIAARVNRWRGKV